MKTGYLESISLKSKKTLCIDLGDTFITVVSAGTYNGNDQYQWSSTSPTEGLECDHKSELIDYDKLILRLDMFNYSIKSEEKHAIKLFLGD